MSAARVISLIIVNTLAWLLFHVGWVWLGNKVPRAFFARPRAFLRVYGFERSGFFYERILFVKRWKELLPDAAGWMAGGFEKKRLRGRDPDYLRDFLHETRRAELVHWLVFCSAALFYFWNPAWVVKWMFLYSSLANLPCIIVQRYNRARFERLLEI